MSIQQIKSGVIADSAVTDTKLTLAANSSAIKTALNASGDAPIYSCRAWVNFNGTGTVAIREDGNVSSITDNGTGDYTINFTTAMPDANYAVTTGTNIVQTYSGETTAIESITTSSFAIRHAEAGSFYDASYIAASIFR